ncbi:DMT family transporter [Alteromonas sp. H39]|uniref:DMT family transporter n=1 Tax=Alteromonas sp. H39 TaxID=3389876 RepID=UPI0039DF71D8
MSNPVRPGLGFALALFTAFLWGILPIFLAICLQVMDSPTITVYRFLTAAAVVGLLLWKKQQLPRFFRLPLLIKLMAVSATLMLVTNYVTNVMGLLYLSPASAQVLMQIAPFALMIGGILLYKEHFTLLQFIGAVSLLSGLLLFFNHRLPQIIASESEDVLGIVFIVIAALTWAAYALCQKALMQHMTAMQLTLVLYIVGSMMLLPFSELNHVWDMNRLQFFALLFCCLNTIFGYGAFTEAMRVWHASRVSAVLALAPLFTFISMLIAERLLPSMFTQPALNTTAYVGAFMVITGSVLASLGRERLRAVG